MNKVERVKILLVWESVSPTHQQRNTLLYFHILKSVGRKGGEGGRRKFVITDFFLTRTQTSVWSISFGSSLDHTSFAFSSRRFRIRSQNIINFHSRQTRFFPRGCRCRCCHATHFNLSSFQFNNIVWRLIFLRGTLLSFKMLFNSIFGSYFLPRSGSDQPF